MTSGAHTNSVKNVVRRYFDGEVSGCLEAYQKGQPGDARHDTFQERRDLVLDLTPPSARRVLDIGAGPGVFTPRLLARGASCCVVDLSFEMVAAAAGHVPSGPAGRASFMVGDIDRLPFAGASFDASLCVGVLQYLPSLELAFRELARVTVPGGHVIVTFPNARSPLNRLHRLAIGGARAGQALTARLRIGAAPDPSRLTFRRDIPNRWFSLSEILVGASAADLVLDRAIYHVLQFPFAIPGLGFAVRAWNDAVRGRFPRGPSAAWGREAIVRFTRAR